MKFATLIALVAVAHAQDEEAAEGEAAEALEKGADCAAEGSVCGEGLWCGTATGAESEEGAGDGASLTVCNESDATTFDDTEGDSGEELAFACNAVAEEGGAAHLAASTAALLSAAYLLAWANSRWMKV